MKEACKPVVFQSRQNPNAYDVYLPNSRVDGSKHWLDIACVVVSGTNTNEYQFNYDAEAAKVPTHCQGYKRIAKKNYPKEVQHMIDYHFSDKS